MYQRTGFTADDFQAVLAPMETEKNEDGVVHKVRPPRPVEEDGGQLVAREQGAGKPGAHRVALIPRKEGDEGAKYLQYIQVLGAVERQGQFTAVDRIPYKEGREVFAQCKEGRCDMLLKGEADKKRHAMAHKLLGEMRANKRPPAKKREIAGGDEEQESLERVIPLDARPKASAGECPPTTRPKKKARATGADGKGAFVVKRDFATKEPLVDVSTDAHALRWLWQTQCWQVKETVGLEVAVFPLLNGATIPRTCAKTIGSCSHRRHLAYVEEARNRALQWMNNPTAAGGNMAPPDQIVRFEGESEPSDGGNLYQMVEYPPSADDGCSDADSML